MSGRSDAGTSLTSTSSSTASRLASSQARALGGGDELDHHLVEHGFEPGILVGAAIGGQDALVLALRRSGQLLLLGLPRRLRERWQRPWRRADREQGRTAARKREPENADTRNRAGQMKRPRHPAPSARSSGRAVAAASVFLYGFHDAIREFPSVPACDLDLLRAGSLDARPVAFLDPPADPNATIFKLFRL